MMEVEIPCTCYRPPIPVYVRARLCVLRRACLTRLTNSIGVRVRAYDYLRVHLLEALCRPCVLPPTAIWGGGCLPVPISVYHLDHV